MICGAYFHPLLVVCQKVPDVWDITRWDRFITIIVLLRGCEFSSKRFPMLNMSTPSELKSPCMTRNGMVKLAPSQPNGLGSASITKGTPAAKNRLCQSSSVPSILPPPPSSLPYHHHLHHLDSPGMHHTAAPLLPSDLEPGKPLVGLKPSLRQLPPLTLPKPVLLERQLVLDEKLLNRLLWYFTTAEKCVLAQVCKTWRKVLYQPKFWEGVTPILHAKELYNILPNGEKEFVSLQAFALRGFQSFCLVGVSDLDICEFIDNYPLSKKGVRSLSLKRSTITDAGLEVSLFLLYKCI
ncbi:F-box/LRR-repeat protein 16 [Characodon lateralis]|uniref:F-box/LRR-repeat protein 16 n=1 Tax=Characodon lateralis TaxID=208331 RepID=A0ABU7F1X8_9TELE|nr:F-box/LRR-repeat protein 16 [Characodon lateralis]